MCKKIWAFGDLHPEIMGQKVGKLVYTIYIIGECPPQVIWKLFVNCEGTYWVRVLRKSRLPTQIITVLNFEANMNTVRIANPVNCSYLSSYHRFLLALKQIKQAQENVVMMINYCVQSTRVRLVSFAEPAMSWFVRNALCPITMRKPVIMISKMSTRFTKRN